MDVRLEQPDAENDLQFSGRFSFRRACEQGLSRHCGEREVVAAQPEGPTPAAAAVLLELCVPLMQLNVLMLRQEMLSGRFHTSFSAADRVSSWGLNEDLKKEQQAKSRLESPGRRGLRAHAVHVPSRGVILIGDVDKAELGCRSVSLMVGWA